MARNPRDMVVRPREPTALGLPQQSRPRDGRRRGGSPPRPTRPLSRSPPGKSRNRGHGRHVAGLRFPRTWPEGPPLTTSPLRPRWPPNDGSGRLRVLYGGLLALCPGRSPLPPDRPHASRRRSSAATFCRKTPSPDRHRVLRASSQPSNILSGSALAPNQGKRYKNITLFI